MGLLDREYMRLEGTGGHWPHQESAQTQNMLLQVAGDQIGGFVKELKIWLAHHNPVAGLMDSNSDSAHIGDP